MLDTSHDAAARAAPHLNGGTEAAPLRRQALLDAVGRQARRKETQPAAARLQAAAGDDDLAAVARHAEEGRGGVCDGAAA